MWSLYSQQNKKVLFMDVQIMDVIFRRSLTQTGATEGSGESAAKHFSDKYW